MPRTAARGGPQTRARIVEAAGRLFLERGFDQVTVAEVAREAGVSSVTVFNHFPRKEDLYLDRAADAEALLRSAVRDRGAGDDSLTALERMLRRLADDRSPLSGLDPRSVPFFATVAASPGLVARARELLAGLGRTLADELRADPDLPGDVEVLAAVIVAGYGAIMVSTAKRLVAGIAPDELVADHLAALDRLFSGLRNGFPAAKR